MPEVAVRTRTECSEGDVYQRGSLSRNCPSRVGHVTQPCSIRALHQWLGEEVRAPSFPWPHPAATGEPQPSPSSHGSYTWTREMYFPDVDCGGRLCSGEGAAAGSGAPCRDAAHLQGCHENRPRSRSERGGDVERGAAGRLGSVAQALVEEAKKNNQRPGAGKCLEQLGEQADGEKQLGIGLSYLKTRRTNLH